MENDNKSKTAILRQKAEELLNDSASLSDGKTHQPVNPSTCQPAHLSESETLKLIHELEVHQIELEIQNEELRVAKEQSKNSFEKYSELYDFAPSGYFTLLKEGEIIELNLAGANIFGVDRSRLINHRFDFFVTRDTKPIFTLFLEKIFDSKSKETCEVTLSTNGNLPMYVHLAGIATENGEKCLLTVVDLSGRKETEKELKETNNKLTRAQHVAHIGSWENYLPTNELKWSEEMYKIMGFPGNSPITLTEAVRVFPPEETERFKQAVSLAIKEDAPYRMDYKIIRLDGLIRYIHDEGEVIRDEHGQAVFMFGTTQDITERKQIEENLQNSEKKFRNLVEKALIAIYSTNLNGKLLFANEAMSKMLEYDSIDEYMKADVKSTYKKKEEREKFIEILQKSKQIFNYELELITKTGKTIDVIVNAFISGDVITGMIMDISERKKAEKAFQEKMDELMRFQRLTVGRELTMIELKKEVNELLRKSGQEEKYKIVG